MRRHGASRLRVARCEIVSSRGALRASRGGFDWGHTSRVKQFDGLSTSEPERGFHAAGTASRRPLWVEPRQVSLGFEDGPQVRDKPLGNCVLLHGWNSPAWYLDGIKSHLKALPQAAGWRFWSVDYQTHTRGFPDSAQAVVDEMARRDDDFSNTVLLGYSMGGLVARQMVAIGFPVRALVSICSPHQGLSRWILAHSPGTRSLRHMSTDVQALNADATDRDARARYHFFGITYSDLRGFHPDDTIVAARSALGESLGEVATRRAIHLRYGARFAGGDPHLRGMQPRFLAPVFETCARVFEHENASS